MTAPAAYALDPDLRPHLDAAAELHGTLFERPWSRTVLEELLAVPGTAGAAVHSTDGDRRFRGFVLFRSLGDFAEILTLAVAPPERGRGLGRRLMEHAVRAARESGAERLILEVQDGNHAAISLYQNLGMTAFDRRRNYYNLGDGSHADAIMMQLNFDT